MEDYKGLKGLVVCEEGLSGAICLTDTPNEGSSKLDLWALRDSMEKMEATANLIMAAPDLLDACRTGLEAISALMEHQDGWDDDMEKVRAAIAKALVE